jgi:osmotically-inducible protein OsmY
VDPPAGQQQLLADVLRSLMKAGYAPLRCVQCTVEDGLVILEGALPSYYLKQCAQSAVLQIPGVRRIDNRIEVANARRLRLGRSMQETAGAVEVQP